MLRCLHILTHKLPGAPLGCQIYEFYYQSLLGNITESDHFNLAWKFVELLARQQLEEGVNKCIKLLKQTSNPRLTEIAKTLEDFIQELASISFITDNDKQIVHRSNKGPKKKTHPTVFEDIRRRLVDYLLDVFQKHLRHIGTFPLHEIFYFNQSSWLRRHLNPVISSTMHRAL
ncbi:origin recognition complex subunit 3-like [Dysidea avara]|uniref:origin recognition complex subunit 3-like n=1 Tax=Dysidea avara TaxID=196820 RepID=UPI00332DFCAE